MQVCTRHQVALLYLCFLVSSLAYSQGPLNQLTQFGEVQHFGVDSIDLSTLDVRLDVTLLSKRGRGADLNIKLSHSNVFTYQAGNYGWIPVLQGLIGKVSYTTAGCSNVGCGYIDWIYTDPYGTEHIFGGAVYSTKTGATPGTATDGTGLVITPGLGLATISAPNGASWQVPSQNGGAFIPGGYQQDNNGNVVSETATGITDTLGATIQVANYTQINKSVASPPQETYTYFDSTGTSRQIKINTTLESLSPNIPASPCANNFPPPETGATSVPVDLPTSVTLANGTAYTFSYEPSSNPTGTSTGRLSQITLPTGGSISYAYPSAASLVTGDPNCRDNGAFFLTRTTADGAWRYTRTLSNYGYDACTAAGNCASYPPPVATTTVVDPKGNTTVYTFMNYPNPFFAGLYTYLETSKAVYQGSATGTPIMLQQTCYNGFSPPCAVETSLNLPNVSTGTISTKDVYTSYNGVASSRTTTTYNIPLYAPVEIDEYDFGATTATRVTKTQYLSINGVQTTKPLLVSVYQGGALVAETQYGYDSPAATTTSNVVSHNAVSGQRGNITSKSAWNNTSNSWITWNYTNDDTGNRLSEEDPNQNPLTYYSYSDSWYSNSSICAPSGGQSTNAFVTITTDALGHQSSQSYDACTGLSRQQRDSNDIGNNRQGTITSYDEMNAATSVSYSDGGSVTTNYGSYALPLTITTTQLASPNPSLITTTVMDGYGRVAKSIISSDPQGPSETDFSYDPDGLPYSTTNPYRTNTEPTYGTYYLSYDALGRRSKRLNPDNTSEIWSYSGPTTTVTDERNNQRVQTTDALGRLTKVLEPNGIAASASMETDYSYDALDNLVSISQKGAGADIARTRSFYYDSLARMTQQFNPESGWTCFGSTGGVTPTGSNCAEAYDANGNLMSKTDSRAVTAAYTYDALNRIVSKSYTNDPNGTPSSCYQYDGGATANLIGRLANEWTQRGACPVSAPSTFQSATILTRKSILAYDALGRVISEQQCTLANCNSTVLYSPTYTYDLSGNIQTHTNGMGSIPGLITFTNTYNAALRPSTVSGGSFTGNLFSSPSYTASGSLTNATLGSGVVLQRSYDNRLRVTGETDSGNQSSTALGTASITISGSEQTH